MIIIREIFNIIVYLHELHTEITQFIRNIEQAHP